MMDLRSSIAAALLSIVFAAASTASPDQPWIRAIDAGQYAVAERDLRARLETLTGEERNAALFALGFALAKQDKFDECRAVIAAIDSGSDWAKDGRAVLEAYTPPPSSPVRSTAGAAPVIHLAIKDGKSLAIGADRYTLTGGAIHRNRRKVDSPFVLPPTASIDGRRYRGTLEVIQEKGRLAVVNTISVEEYLYGVLKNEIGPSWPSEALKAQAIASRTFVLRRMALAKATATGRARLASDVSIQVYKGRGSEDPRITAVVDATRGMVLTYGSELIEAVFHSESGGKLESSADVWRRAYPYLISQNDPFGGTSPKNEWQAEFTEQELVRALDKKTRARIGRIDSIEIAERTAGGRARVLSITGSHGTAAVPAAQYRLDLGPDRLRSLFWTEFQYHAGKLHVAGRGWGHGVGMSQWSAKAAAESGLTAAQILNLYYPGSRIETRY